MEQINNKYKILFEMNYKETEKRLYHIVSIILDMKSPSQISKSLYKKVLIAKHKLAQYINYKDSCKISFNVLMDIILEYKLDIHDVVIYNHQLKEYEDLLYEFNTYIENFKKHKDNFIKPSHLELIYYNNLKEEVNDYRISEIIGALPLLTDEEIKIVISKFNEDSIKLNANKIIHSIMGFALNSQFKDAAYYYLFMKLKGRNIFNDCSPFNSSSRLKRGADEYFERSEKLRLLYSEKAWESIQRKMKERSIS